MTKLDFFKKCENFPFTKWEIWKALGSQEISENTRYLAANTVYRLKVNPVSSNNLDLKLYDSLIFCTKEFIEGASKVTSGVANLFAWDSIHIGPVNKGIYQLYFNNEDYPNPIIIPNIYMILPGDEITQESSWEADWNENKSTFIPFDESYIGNSTGIKPSPDDNSDKYPAGNPKVVISELDYENCLKCLGYPFITEEELEYSREEIINLAIKPALEEYFHWLPFERTEEYSVTGKVQYIPFPPDAYTVLGVSVQQRGTHGSGNITNTLLRYFDEAAYGTYNYSGMTGNYKGTFRPHTAQGGPESFISNRALVQATTNLNTRVHFDIVTQKEDSIPIYKLDENGKEIRDNQGNKILDHYESRMTSGKFLRIYSNKLGAFNIHWAIHSLNFDDIEYAQRQNVFKYCQAEIKELFGNLRRQAKSDIPGAIDYSTWITEAEEAKKEVVADWKQLVKASSIIRGSL